MFGISNKTNNEYKMNKNKTNKNKYKIGNIFASPKDTVSRCLTKLCFQKCFYETNTKNIVKYIINEDIFKWETKVYLYLLNKNLVPLASCNKQQVCYYTSEYITLYDYILTLNDSNIHYILNEVFSFIKSFITNGFVHGNLNVFNLFVKVNKKGNLVCFKTIDFSNSYIIETGPDYTRSLDTLESNSDNILYWDLFTLYKSIKEYTKNKFSKETDMYLERLITNYVDPKILIELSDYYNSIQVYYTNQKLLK